MASDEPAVASDELAVASDKAVVASDEAAQAACKGMLCMTQTCKPEMLCALPFELLSRDARVRQ